MDPSRYADPECTRCEGKGWVVTTSTRTGTGWRDDGHGNPIPVPVPEPTQERDLCGCLDERRALHERAEQERVEDWTDDVLASYLEDIAGSRLMEPDKLGVLKRRLREAARRLRARQREEGEGRLEQIADVIRHAENRAMATDGPVSKTSNVITEDELRRIYELATATPQREGDGSCRICDRPTEGVTLCRYCDRMMGHLEGEGEAVRFVGVTTQSFPDGEWLQGLTADGRLYQWSGAYWQELTDGPLYTEPPAQRDLDDG